MGLQKQSRYINRKLLDLAKGMPCMHCGIEDGTKYRISYNGRVWNGAALIMEAQ